VINRVNSMTHLGKALAVEPRHIPSVFESNMMRFAVAQGVPPPFPAGVFVVHTREAVPNEERQVGCESSEHKPRGVPA
jgi:hypothetical protein